MNAIPVTVAAPVPAEDLYDELPQGFRWRVKTILGGLPQVDLQRKMLVGWHTVDSMIPVAESATPEQRILWAKRELWKNACERAKVRAYVKEANRR